MTKRKPLEWTTIALAGKGYAHLPDCRYCQDWLDRPHMAEAIASVGIETGGVNVRRMVDQYHTNRHQEED